MPTLHTVYVTQSTSFITWPNSKYTPNTVGFLLSRYGLQTGGTQTDVGLSLGDVKD